MLHYIFNLATASGVPITGPVPNLRVVSSRYFDGHALVAIEFEDSLLGSGTGDYRLVALPLHAILPELDYRFSQVCAVSQVITLVLTNF